MSDAPEDKQPGRGIEGIAHHFLSGLSGKPVAAKRQSPPSPPASNFEKRAVSPVTPVSKPLAMTRTVVFGDHLDKIGDNIKYFAQNTAQEEGPVALLDLTDTFTLRLSEFRLEGGSDGALDLLDESIDSAWQELFGTSPEQSPQPESSIEEFSDRLTLLPQQVNSLLIHLSTRMNEQEKKLITLSDQVVLLCREDQEQLVKTYQVIKRLIAAVGPVPLSVYFCGQKEEEECFEIFGKLSKAAGEFLDCQIEWAGCDQVVDSVCKSETQAIKRSDEMMECIYDFLSKTNSEPCKINASTPERSSKIWKPLMVSELPNSDMGLVNVLAQEPQAWLAEMQGPQRLELPLPDSLDPRTQVLIDAAGGFHVLLASLGDVEELLGAALDVRQWLREHFELIQGYCNETLIDREKAIGIILVSSGGTERKRAWADQLEFPCRIVQAYLLADENIKGILLV